MPFEVWFSFNFGDTPFNLLFIFNSDSYSCCHSSCNKLLILFPKSEATIMFEASFIDRASFAASSASSLPFMPTWFGIQQKIISFPLDFQLRSIWSVHVDVMAEVNPRQWRNGADIRPRQLRCIQSVHADAMAEVNPSWLYFSNTLTILGFVGEVCTNACRHDIEKYIVFVVCLLNVFQSYIDCSSLSCENWWMICEAAHKDFSLWQQPWPLSHPS